MNKNTKFKTVDIETIDWTEFLVACIYDGENYLLFHTIGELFDYMVNDDGALYFAHNGGKFDYLFLYEYAHKNNYQVNIVPQGSRIMKMELARNWKVSFDYKIENGIKTKVIDKIKPLDGCTCLDSMMVLPAGLADLGEKFGFEKSELNYEDMRNEMRKGKVIPYLKNDCFILYNILYKYNEILIRLGYHLDITLASIASKIYKKNYFKQTWNIDKPHNAEIRPSYSGGRCEIYKFHGINGNYYDINSCYPNAMQLKLPAGDIQEIISPSDMKRILHQKDSVGFIKCTVKVKDRHMPLLPYKEKGKLLFPIGTISGTFTLHELRLAMLQGDKVLNMVTLYHFPKADFIMRDFALKLYDERVKAKSEAEKYVFKIALNSAYGKFAILPDREQFIKVQSDKLSDYHGLTPYANDIYRRKYQVKFDSSKVAIASYITSYARMHLSKYLNDATLYCDTDGFFTTSNFDSDLGNELGKLKKREYIEAWFYQPKVYKVIWRDEKIDKDGNSDKVQRKAKGFGRIKTDDIWDSLIRKEQIDYYHIMTFKEMVKETTVSMQRISRKKQMVAPYDKRIKVGNNTKPKEITEK